MNHAFALVLLQRSSPIDPQSLLGSLRQRHPDRSWSVDPASWPSSPFIRCDDQFVVLTLREAPLPDDEGLLQRATVTWPNARNDIAQVRAVLVIELMRAADNARPEAAKIITAVAGGIIATSEHVCGVVHNGLVARSSQNWLDMARHAFAPYPNYPSILWFDIVPVQLNPQSCAAITVGLAPFIGREVEFEVPGFSGSALIQRVAGLASYLIEHGHTIKDGDTIGASQSERFEVHHRICRFTVAPVLRIGADLPGGPFEAYDLIEPTFAESDPVLSLLSEVGLFDAKARANRVALQPANFVSEQRLDNYDDGIRGVLAQIQSTTAYAAADRNARALLVRGDVEAAKAVMLPYAKDVGQLQSAMAVALMRGDLFMFMPKPSPSKQPWYRRWLAK